MNVEERRTRTRPPCGCTAAEASELLEENTTHALDGDQHAQVLMGEAVEHALVRGGLFPAVRR